MMQSETDIPYKDLRQVFQKEKESLNVFPYSTKISFTPIYRHLQKIAKRDDFIDQSLAEVIIQKIEAKPELLESPSFEMVQENTDILSRLLSGFFPPLIDENQFGYIAAPFAKIPLYNSQHFQDLILTDGVKININIEEEEIHRRMVSNACGLILEKYYGQSFKPVYPTIISIQNSTTHLEKHLKLNIVNDFVEVEAIKPLKKLTKEQVRDLILTPLDPEKWLKLLPPENFEFKGIFFVHFTDVTELEIISRMKDKMLGKNPTHFTKDVDFVQHQLRSLYQNANISMGMVSLDHSFANLVNDVYRFSFSALEEKAVSLKPETIPGSLYHQVWQTKEYIVVEDLSQLKNPTEVEELLIEKGVRSMLLYPSTNQDPRLEQIIELYSNDTKAFNYDSLTKLKIILPLIEAGLNKKRDELDGAISNIIQDQFTNIDPSVHWKFRDTAIQTLKGTEGAKDNSFEIKPIVFQEVYPLYGQADIVSSSTHRNKAIQADLVENLNLLKDTLSQITPQSQIHLLDYYIEKVSKLKEEIKGSFSPTDETRIMDLLKFDIHPCLEQIQKDSTSKNNEIIQQYFDQLNPSLGVIYRFRKNFEDSVAMVNETIAHIIQSADDEMQESLPHYFEKYKTDGVEYNIYLGQSILNKQQFSIYHLKDFRLWQLITMCKVTKGVKDLQNQLPKKLTTAQLIFTYSDPLDIRFRMDEKHFDVDGAYNIRYEIIKKRIDKAYIADTDERLTQSGKIAIVYLHDKDRIEYLDYFNYLLSKGMITPDIEELNLGKLQGVQGLKALRVTVA